MQPLANPITRTKFHNQQVHSALGNEDCPWVLILWAGHLGSKGRCLFDLLLRAHSQEAYRCERSLGYFPWKGFVPKGLVSLLKCNNCSCKTPLPLTLGDVGRVLAVFA